MYRLFGLSVVLTRISSYVIVLIDLFLLLRFIYLRVDQHFWDKNYSVMEEVVRRENRD